MFYLIDKPIHISSFDVIRKIRKTFGIRKMGHCGTLDPLASGCILIATENSTKLIPLLEKLEKTYLFTVRIDGKTSSLDMDTPIEPCNYYNYINRSSADLEKYLLDQNEQIPPIYSALHVDGERAYNLARKGINPVLKKREIKVNSVEIIDFSPPSFQIRLKISSGGYIRSFAPLIGEFFGTDGGYITELRREIIHLDKDSLNVNKAKKLETLNKNDFISYTELFPNIPTIKITEFECGELKLGRTIPTQIQSYNDGQKFFLKNDDFFTSLVKFNNNSFQIVRNDV